MSAPPPPDNVLIQRYRDGDHGALGLLLERHERMLYNTVLRMVSNRDDAAEVTQDAMLKVVQHIDTFREDARFTTWATRIAMNCAISKLRRRKIRKMQSLDAPMGHDPDAGSMIQTISDETTRSPDDTVEYNDRVDLVRRAIDEVDEPFRAVLVLRDIQGMEYEEIAQTLDIAKGTVKSRLFRARVALRDVIRRLDPTAEIPEKDSPG